MEAGMFPGIAAQLCSWYRSDEMGKPIMWMFGFQNCSGIVGSLLAYGISYMDGMRGMSAWQWVYLLEGVATMVFSIVVFFVLPDYPKSPRSNSWLTPREQEYLEARLSENAPRTEDAAFSKSEIIASLRNPRTYSFMLSQLLLNLGGYGLSWQLPTVTTSLGFAGLPRNQLLNIPPSAASVLAIIFAGWFLDRAYMTRPAFIMWICAGALAFFIVLAATTEKYAVYVACVLGTMFYSVYFIPFWACKSFPDSDSFLTLVGTTRLTRQRRAFLITYGHHGHSIHTSLPILCWTGRWCRWTTDVQIALRLQRVQTTFWYLCRCHWVWLAC